ncbi:MAG: BREX system Lon protease-like protein BrxL [Candidatus Wallbacteria bacterium]
MNELDKKINDYFTGLVVRKDLVKLVKGNAIVPTYVLEYLLGQYCATNDEPSIISGIETVKEILKNHYVHRNEAGLVRSMIREKGRYKVIDKISVSLNDKKDTYEAEFSNLGIDKLLVDSSTVKTYPRLLVSGVWCIADVEYDYREDKSICPWVLSTIKPIQLADFDFESYTALREKFTTDEWIDILIQSIGFNPELFSRRSKLTQLVRLIPFCERNYNLIELGPKGTGKSHIYSELSPHGILISGGEVTVPKLFVNNSTGRIGLVGYWDAVAFDEFAGKQKRVDKALVDIMKNYMANKSFSRGVETLGAEASMVFVGNTQHIVPYMLKYNDLFDDLPDKYYDSAFLDRLHYYIPGWEVDIIRGEMFSDGYGFIVDYLAEALRKLRNFDYSDRYKQYCKISDNISTRDRDGINKTFSGLMKILFPAGNAKPEEIEELLRFAMEGRKRVKDQLMRIDTTYTAVKFSFTGINGKEQAVTTLEEDEYPRYYYKKRMYSSAGPEKTESSETSPAISAEPLQESPAEPAPTGLAEKHVVIKENQRGITYESLFWPYIEGASKIVITDPYIRVFHQVRNLMEFLEIIAKNKPCEDEFNVHLVTVDAQQQELLIQLKDACSGTGINFSWEFEENTSIHARHIVTDHGWKILLDRGLDIFQIYDWKNVLAFTNHLQQVRTCKAFEVTYIKNKE